MLQWLWKLLGWRRFNKGSAIVWVLGVDEQTAKAEADKILNLVSDDEGSNWIVTLDLRGWR